MKYYDQDPKVTEYISKFLFRFPNWISLIIVLTSIFLVIFIPNNINLRAVLWSYFIFGGLSDLVVNFVIGNIWGRGTPKKYLGTLTDLKDLKNASWIPRIVGILERIIFTTSFIFGRFELVGFWLVLKVIGNWQSNPTPVSYSKKQKQSKLWRVKENIFLIGTASSLILSLISAFVYFKIIDNKSKYFDKKMSQINYKIINLHNCYHNNGY